MRFEVIEYGAYKNDERRWGVEQVDLGPAVLELNFYAPYDPQVDNLRFTKSEATSLCCMMNDLFAQIDGSVEVEKRI